MPKRLRMLLPTALAVSVAAAAAAAPAAADPEPPAAQWQPEAVEWEPCEDVEDVECGVLEVPLDWDEPDGETIEIGLARRAAQDPEAQDGSLLMDPGGPGGSGVDAVKADPEMFTEEVRERFDVVGFDPRGVNTSTAIECDEELVEEAASLIPDSAEEFEARAELNAELAEDCRARTGPLYDHVDNLHVVQDMEAIRQALGDDELSYVGYSYGSLMGQQYAEEFGDRVRAMVLDGNMDHSLDSTWEFMDTETAPVEETFNQFADWCAGETDCALYGEDVRAEYGELREAAKAGELVDPDTGEAIDFFELSAGLGFGSVFPESWPEIAEGIDALRQGQSPGDALADPPTADNTTNFMMQAAWCQDWDYPVEDYREWVDLRDRLAEAHPVVQWTPYAEHTLTCVGYPGETTNPQAPLDIDDDVAPLLMVGTVHDFATVYPWTQTAAEQSDSALLTYEGYGHTIYGYDSDCVNDVVDSYLIDLEVPDDGASCPGLEEPGVAVGDGPSRAGGAYGLG